MPTENQPERARRANISYQTISLAQAAVVNGLQWQLYPVDFKTEEGTFSVYLYAINREHAAAILLELKETAVLRDGDLAGIARND